MASFNKVILLGNLTRDPQLRYLPSQMAVCDFGLAMNRKFRTQSGEDREEVTFVDITAFGKQAEVLNQYCTKGKPLFIEGRLKYDTWEDKQGGGKRSKITVVVDNFQFVGGRDGGGAGGGGNAGGGEYSEDEGMRQPQRSSGGGGGGGYGGGNRSGGPARGGNNQQRPPAEPPFGDEQQFKDEDIPF